MIARALSWLRGRVTLLFGGVRCSGCGAIAESRWAARSKRWQLVDYSQPEIWRCLKCRGWRLVAAGARRVRR